MHLNCNGSTLQSEQKKQLEGPTRDYLNHTRTKILSPKAMHVLCPTTEMHTQSWFVLNQDVYIYFPIINKPAIEL